MALLRFLAESALTLVVTLHDRIAEVYQVRADIDATADGRPRIRYQRPGAGAGIG